MKLFLIVLFIFAIIFFYEESFGFFHDEIYAEELTPNLIDSNFEIQVIQTGLNFPTKITFVDKDTILIAQRTDGQVVVIKNFQLIEKAALDLNVESGHERGLIGLTSSKFNDKTFVFVYYTESAKKYDTNIPCDEKNNNLGNKLVRYVWDGSTLIEPKLLLYPLNYTKKFHSGGAMTTLENQLYIIIGDNLNENGFLTNTQSNERHYDRGVLFRIDFEGNAFPNNPFPESDLSKYYAFGIRNGYGLTVDPVTQNIWDTENGPEDFDEINLVFSGFNSGWKQIMGPKMDDLAAFPNLTKLDGSEYSDPEFSWKTSIGVTEIEFLKSEKYGTELANDVFVGDVRGRLYHFNLNEDRTSFVFSDPMLDDLVADSQNETSSIIFGTNLGIITDIKTGPDGFLYIISMIEGRGWEQFAGNYKNPDLKKQGSMQGVIFRIIPKSLDWNEIKNLPPKAQIQNGVLPSDLNCKIGLQLVFKKTNNSPACVRIETAEKLIERGWSS